MALDCAQMGSQELGVAYRGGSLLVTSACSV